MDKKFEKTLNLIQNKTLRENFNVQFVVEYQKMIQKEEWVLGHDLMVL